MYRITCQYRLFFKVFNDNSRILAIKTSGNVFAAEAVEELNFKAKGWNDLLTGEAFTKRVRGLRNHLVILQPVGGFVKRLACFRNGRGVCEASEGFANRRGVYETDM